MVALGATSYVLGGPIVHWMRGNAGRGFGSLGLRLLVPPAFALVGAFVGFEAFGGSSADSLAPLVGIFLGGYAGGMAGILCASTIDIAALARDSGPAKPALQSTWTLHPVTAFVRDAQNNRTPIMGVGGSF